MSLRSKFTPEQAKIADALVAQHGKGVLFAQLVPLDHLPTGELELVIVRRPSPGEWAEFMSMAHDEEKKSAAVRDLMEHLAVHPAGDDWRDLVRRYPGLPTSIYTGRMSDWLAVGVKSEGEAL